MAGKTLLRSFAGGEITPELAGRLDLVKYQTGLSLCRNFITLPHGPAVRRPGFSYINEVKDSTHKVRLLPFSFSATQTAIIELGHQYIRFHLDGGTLLEDGLTITAISKASPGVLTYTGTDPSNGDWMFLQSIGGMTELNSRWVKVAGVNTSANTFQLTDLAGANIDTTGYTTYTSGGTASRAYTISSPYAEADLFDISYTQSADVITLVHPSYPAKELARLGATNWTLTDIPFAAPATVPTGVSAVATVAQSSYLTTQKYVVTAVADDGVTETLASAEASCSNNLGLAGNYNTITWTAVSGYSRYNVYKQFGGIFGYIGQVKTAAGLTLTDDNITPDTTSSPPEDIIKLNTGADDYPGAVCYHEQRRWFAGTNSKPQVMFATRTATESNLTSSIPSRADDGLEIRVATGQYNQIQHLVPLADLMAFTAGGEFRIFADSAPAITPTSVSIKPQAYTGANGVQPIMTSGSVLYVQAQGSRVRELAYNWESSAYRTVDISIMAPHRFDGHTLTQLAYTRAPDSVLWAVRDDGVLLGMSYVPDQQVYGWHAHDTTNGTFESIAVVAEGNEDVLYAVIKRTIDGRDVRYIERMSARTFVYQDYAFFVDSGLRYDGAAVTSLSGLWHLEGEDVDILADGAVMPRQTVTNGEVTLDTAASVISIGLPITADFRSLPLALEGMQAAGQGTTKNVNKVHLRVRQSSIVKAGPSFDRLREYPARAITDPYGSPPALRDGELSLAIDPSWNTDGAVCVRQDLPLPLSILSMTLEIQVGG